MFLIVIILILLINILYLSIKSYRNNFNTITNLKLIKTQLNIPKIPIVVISWNSLTFIKNFINQIKKLPNDIIILDNNSSYPALHKYYDILKNELGDKINIKQLKENYGHEVYLKRRDLLPDIYILSDPDLQLNPKMPLNVSDILYCISNKYNIFKVGLCLDISDHINFEETKNYMAPNTTIKKWESQFWKKQIKNDIYELYDADIDTTFSLVNWHYYNENKYKGIRIGNNFTAKHLPWYKNYYENNFTKEELYYLKKNNKSSTIIKLLYK